MKIEIEIKEKNTKINNYYVANIYFNNIWQTEVIAEQDSPDLGHLINCVTHSICRIIKNEKITLSEKIVKL